MPDSSPSSHTRAASDHRTTSSSSRREFIDCGSDARDARDGESSRRASAMPDSGRGYFTASGAYPDQIQAI